MQRLLRSDLFNLKKDAITLMLLYQSAWHPKTPDIQVHWNTANNSAQDVL